MRLLAVLGVVAAVVAAPAVLAQNYSAMMSKAKAVVSHESKDPESAKFRNLGIYRSKTGKPDPYVCGEVNDKNSYGAYVGYKRFVVADGIADIDEGDELVMITALCAFLIKKVNLQEIRQIVLRDLQRLCVA